MDIALDPFPYNGTTTTCEALLMGVPVITYKGAQHGGRVGASLLGAAGVEELVAVDKDHYVVLAAELAADGGRLKALRADLRERMEASPLTDGAAFTAKMETAYRNIWKTWVGQ
jgi:predicted O-linked N-acetylglucosamine transferase (SPINDLY family)